MDSKEQSNNILLGKKFQYNNDDNQFESIINDNDDNDSESITFLDKTKKTINTNSTSLDNSDNYLLNETKINNSNDNNLLNTSINNNKETNINNTAAALELLLNSNEKISDLQDENNVEKQLQYNDYINQVYSDESRLENLQENNKTNLDKLVLDVQFHQEQENEQVLNVKNEKRDKLKSIVKSPSSQSFLKKSRKNSKKLNLPNSNTVTAIDDRPAPRVQFENIQTDANDNGTNANLTIIKNNIDSPTSTSSSSSSSSFDGEISDCSDAHKIIAPDGGWGWVVVFASFMINLIADGITFSFGVIFVEFLNYFNEGKAKTAWIGSLFMAIPLLSGPIASFLTDRYGCRKVTIIGSNLACIGFVLSAFSDSMELLFLTFGILAGFGLSLCYVAAVVIVAYYFDKRRSLATGLSVCGSGIGTFIFAPLTQYFLEEYGWRGTTLLLAGFFLNMNIFGLLMRDLKWTTYNEKLKAKNKRNKKGLSVDSFSFSTSTNTASTGHQQGMTAGNLDDTKPEYYDDSRLFSSLVTLPTFIRNGEKVPPEVLELLASHKNLSTIIQNYPNIISSRSFSEPYTSENIIVLNNSNNINQPTNTTNENNLSPLHRKHKKFDDSYLIHHRAQSPPSAAYLKDLRLHRRSLTYRGAMLNISNRYRLRASSCPDIYRNSMTTIAKEKKNWYQGIDEFKSLFVDILDFSYFLDIRFSLFALSNFLLYTWYDVPYVYLGDYAQEIDIDETDASILIGVIGLVNMFGEIFLGWIGDIKGISASFIYAICMILCGIVVCAIPLYKSYLWLAWISAFFGLFIAANYALTSIILVELITIERFTNAYGLLLLVQGIANLVGPPIAGWFYDVLGTYDVTFYIAGIFISLSGILLLIPKIIKYIRDLILARKNNTNSMNKSELNNSTKPNCNGINNIINNDRLLSSKIDNV